MTRLGLRIFFAVALACVGSLQHANAQPPEPPIDANKTIFTAASIDLRFSAERYGEFAIGRQANDFDLRATFVNPATTDWTMGVKFRAVEGQGAYTLLINAKGEIGFEGLGAYGIASVGNRPVGDVMRLGANETNDLALFVRAHRAMVFLNGVYIETFDVSGLCGYGSFALFALGANNGVARARNVSIAIPPSVVPNAGRASARNTQPARIVIETPTLTYEQTGRPLAMDGASNDCNARDESKVARLLRAQTKITNNTPLPMTKWTPIFVKRDNTASFWCFVKELPARINAGETIVVTFESYIEPNEEIAFVIVSDATVGLSNRIRVR